MGNLFKIINAYYDLFESYRSVIYLRNSRIWILIVLSIIFIYTFKWYAKTASTPYVLLGQDSKLVICIALELTILCVWFSLMKQRDLLIVEKVQKYLGVNERNLNKLKRIWLTKSLGIEPVGYLEIAEKIDKYLTLKVKHQSIFTIDLKQILGFIFQPESKNRILAMFMGICAAFIGLSISAGANITYLFDFYDNNSIKNFILLDLTFSILILLGIIIVKYLCLLIFEAIGFLFDKIGKNRSVNQRRSKLFINELLRFYDLPKGKIQVKFDLDQEL